MSDINDGGPAFPNVPSDPGYSIWDTGMSLRDYFAAKASEEDIKKFMPETCGDSDRFFKQYGMRYTRQMARYEHADAMLKAREWRRK